MIPGDMGIGKKNLDAGIFGLQVRETEGSGGKQDESLSGKFGPAGSMAAKINGLQEYFINETRPVIPIIPFEEALHGLVQDGATAFPQAIALAATFDTSLMHEVARAIALETRSRGIRQILSPVLNVASDVRWGRTEETYGEDPFLVSMMGHAYISEFGKAGVIATPKHFIANVGDGGRDSYPVHFSERMLEETFYPPFKTAVQQAHAGSVMTAYNSLDGTPCSSNSRLLQKTLKQEWGFDGFVISDACAVGGANVLHMTATGYEEAGKQAVENGLDVIFQTDFGHAALFSQPFLSGKVRQSAIDSAVSRVLRAKFRLGLFDDPYVDPSSADKINGSAAHRELALRAAREAIVLLKNEGNLLPLTRSPGKIAVIGTDATEARLGGYSGKGNEVVSILEGISRSVPESTEILFSPGCGRSEQTLAPVKGRSLTHPDGTTTVPGLMATYFDNPDLSGNPVVTRTDTAINYSWTLYGPDPVLSADWFSVRWTGSVTSFTGGSKRIGVEGDDGYRLFLDGNLVIDNKTKQSYGMKTVDFLFEPGKAVEIILEYSARSGNNRIRLVWDEGMADTIEEALQFARYLAAESDLAVVVTGIEEGEFRDRSSLKLPGRQEELIHAVAASGKPVVVVLVGGSAITMGNWIDEVQGILNAWYPGEAGGLAVADVLFGRYNPAGRLPVTFPQAGGQLPLTYYHKPTGRGDDYADLSGKPLFPFGFGLSYTTFEYGNLELSKDTITPGDSVILRFRVKNTGSVAGEEVCQVYLRDELASVARPVKELKAFRRIHLLPGETREVVLTLGKDLFSMLNREMKRVVEPGAFTVMVGASSEDIRLRRILWIKKL